VNAYGLGWVSVDGQRYQHNILVDSRGAVEAWEVDGFSHLGPAVFDALAVVGPEIVLFGSGAKLRFPPPAWHAALMKHRIGFETMDSPAACRTYNVLASEGRHVLLALLLE
jgi:uncharacterized protein